MQPRWLLAALPLLAGCSFTVAQGFEECAKDSDCGAGKLCLERYCVQPPEGCNGSYGAVDDPKRIVLAAALPMTTGGSLDGGIDESEAKGLNAITLALDEINQRDGVGGRPFALYTCNTAGDAVRVKAQATWLAEQLRAPVLFTSGSGQTLAAATVTVPRDVLVMTATATSPELSSLPDTNGGPVGLVWRTAPSDAIQGKVIADLLLNDVEFAATTMLGIVYVDDPYGQGLKEVLAARFGADSGNTVRSFQYTRGGDITAAVNGLSDFGPQVTVLIAFPEDALPILAAAKGRPALTKVQGHRWFFTDSAKDPALLASATVSEITDAYGTSPAQGAGQAFPSFRDRFSSKFSVDPSAFSFTSNSYDAMYLVALAAAWAVGSDGAGAVTGPRLAQGLTKLSSGSPFNLSPDQLTPAKAALAAGGTLDIEGASGHLNFDSATGEAPSPIDLWQVKSDGSGFDTRRTIEPP